MLAIILAEGMRRRGARIATRVTAAFLVFLIGLSRVYLGVHHPTDVLAGYTLGIVWISVIRAASSANRRGASPA
jgi:undecaprenyl-diphosphatase